MARNTSVILGKHFDSFVSEKIEQGRYESTSEAVRAGLRLLEENETKLDNLRLALAKGEQELDANLGTDGAAFMYELIDE